MLLSSVYLLKHLRCSKCAPDFETQSSCANSWPFTRPYNSLRPRRGIPGQVGHHIFVLITSSGLRRSLLNDVPGCCGGEWFSEHRRLSTTRHGCPFFPETMARDRMMRSRQKAALPSLLFCCLFFRASRASTTGTLPRSEERSSSTDPVCNKQREPTTSLILVSVYQPSDETSGNENIGGAKVAGEAGDVK